MRRMARRRKNIVGVFGKSLECWHWVASRKTRLRRQCEFVRFAENPNFGYFSRPAVAGVAALFEKIASTIQYPEWVSRYPRYRTLDLRDKLLDGEFYKQLKYAFYDEMDTVGGLIPLTDRRPSAQYRLARMVARWCARKLYAGRHVPRLRHPDPKMAKKIASALAKYKFNERMSEAVLRGSVGSVAITFCCEQSAGKEPKIALDLWPAKYCEPCFDKFGELTRLRVRYVCPMGSFRAAYPDYDGKKDLKDADMVWWVRDHTPEEELTYQPEKKDDWNPADGFTNKAIKEFTPLPGEMGTCKHDFGFVPAHWFINLTGGGDPRSPDGVCTFEDAIPNIIELDYTFSQVGRGVRYNSAPQLVVIGNVLNGDVVRGPMQFIQLQAGFKQEDGETVGAGDAKLLEMNGAGTKVGLETVDKLRNIALEQIAASRKDPDKMKGPLSGRAMEYLDQDSDDLVMDLRSQYGEHGALPLIKKICIATKICSDPSGLTLQWPRLFQPTPDEVFSLVQALALAMNPVQVPGPSTSGPDGVAKPGAPVPSEEHQLLEPDQARAYLAMVLDISMLDVERDDDEGDVPADDDPEPSEVRRGTPTPTPVEDQIDPAGEEPQGDPPDNSAAGFASAGLRFGAPRDVNA